MTLPTDHIYPLISDFPNENDSQLYLRDLVFSLTQRDEELADAINGYFLGDSLAEDQQWTPVLQGSTTGTFTYDHQTGWVQRKGITTDVWFDVQWTASGSASGNLYLILPYQVALSNDKPFVGIVQSSGITFTGGTSIVINAIQNTFRGEFWNTGSSFTTANQQVTSSGQLIGHIRYLGQQDERS